MATKPPQKAKKAAAPKEKKVGRPAKAKSAEPEDGEAREAEGGDDDDEDEDEEMMKAAAKKPLKPSSPKSSTKEGEEQPAVVPARRLTPEAKAKVNQMVAKGMPLGEALKIAASWETFVAPVKDEPAKLVQGRSFEGGGRPRQQRPKEDADEHPEPHQDEDEEPVGVSEAEE
jgi:hypothetical protein